MAVGLFLALLYVKHSLERGDTAVFVAVYFIWLKIAIVIALALLFSCFTSQLLAILFSAGFYVVGLFFSPMRNLDGSQLAPITQTFFSWVSYVLPNFENFNVMAAAAHGRSVPGSLILQNTAYTILYCGIVLAAATVIFSRRNLK